LHRKKLLLSHPETFDEMTEWRRQVRDLVVVAEIAEF
jgi:hypothetical protein